MGEREIVCPITEHLDFLPRESFSDFDYYDEMTMGLTLSPIYSVHQVLGVINCYIGA